MAGPFQQQLIDYYLSQDPRLRRPITSDIPGLPTYLGPSKIVAQPVPYSPVAAPQPDPPMPLYNGPPPTLEEMVARFVAMPEGPEKDALRQHLFGPVR